MQVLSGQWFTDYTKLAASAGIFYGYVFVLSLVLWLVLRYLRADMRLVNMFCVYGERAAAHTYGCPGITWKL
jgi:hypothetical protein